MGFRSGWHAFKAGLDKRYIREYWKAVWEHAWEIWWGAGLVGAVCTILTLYYTPSRWILGWVVAWVFLVAGYYTWRADHVRLENKIRVGRLVPCEWTIAQGQVNAGHLAKRYYFEVSGTSEGSTLEAVSVQLSCISPEVENLNWLPVYLHLQHDNPIRAEDQLRSFDLNPGQTTNVDFVSAIEGDNRFSVVHVVHGVNCHVPFDTNGHRLKVTVTGKHMSAISVWFKVWRNEAGFIECEIEK